MRKDKLYSIYVLLILADLVHDATEQSLSPTQVRLIPKGGSQRR